MTLEWKDPPRIGRGGASLKDWHSIADELRAHPGQWAIVHTGPPTQCTNLGQTIRKAAGSAWRPAGTFEATVNSENGTVTVYARYVGETT